MKLLPALLCAGVLSFPTVGQETREAPVRRKVLDWFESVRGPTLTASTARDVTADLDAFLAKGKDVTLILDGSLTRSKHPLFGTTWGDDVHTFVLTPGLAKAVGLATDRILLSSSPPAGTTRRLEKPMIVLSDAKIDGGSAVPGSTRIEGIASYRFEHQPKDVPLTLRVAYRLEKSIVSYQPRNDISGKGTLSFSIGPINSEAGEVAFGPMPVFIEILMGDVIASNTLALLLDVRPDLDAFARLGIALFDKIADILATVKDRASAAKAIDDFKQLMIRNAALAEAMQKLSPTKEQDAEIEWKYGAKLAAAAKRMQEQVIRLEQAEYAGEAFFEDVGKAVEKKK